MMLVVRTLVSVLGYLSILGLSSLFLGPPWVYETCLVLWLLLLVPVLKFAFRSKAHRRYLASVLLGVLRNPMFSARDVVFLIGQLVIWLRERGRLPRPEQLDNRSPYSLPFEGWWTVYNGGVDRKNSHSWSIITLRYAYDLVVTDERRQMQKNRGGRLEDYRAFGRPILAPADGVVVEVTDGMPDHPNPGSGWFDWRVTEKRERRSLESHGNLGHAAIQPLASPQEERHVGPPPTVDVQFQRHVRWRR